ncbi:hypothetical protein ACHAXR_013046 [Thalassiosira sp. AJA248-18]
MQTAKRILFLSVALQLSLSTMLLASMATRTAAIGTLASVSTAETIFDSTNPPQHRRLKENTIGIADASRRWLELSLESTNKSGDDDNDDDDDDVPKKNYNKSNSTTYVALETKQQQQSEVCTPVEECELCPRNWRVSNEKDDEKVKGEFESCVKYGRRRLFECTELFQKSKSSEKIARSQSEYRPCRFTEGDEQYRMVSAKFIPSVSASSGGNGSISFLTFLPHCCTKVRMQLICLLIGVLSMRNVLRQKVVSASLFDQRRMRLQSANGSSAMKKSSGLQSKNSMETVELIPLMIGAGKMPKSPAPDSNFQTV